VEIKNLNSFRSVKLALEYEIERQAKLLEAGERVHQVTVGWDETRSVTFVQRSKEEAHDYRYFPEPDLPPLSITEDWLEQIRSRLVELPDAKRERFIRDYGLDQRDAGVLVGEREIAEYFEACVRAYNDPVKVAHWISGELFRLLKATETPVNPDKNPPGNTWRS